MLLANHTRESVKRLAQAADHLRQALLLLEETAPGIVDNLDPAIAAPSSDGPPAPDQPSATSGNGAVRLPIADRATFCAHWANQTCYLGNTMPFKLLERLARRPNQLIHCDVLLEELWDRYSSREVLRAAVKMLRRKLISAEMEELADAIDGSTAHHYGLMFNSRLS